MQSVIDKINELQRKHYLIMVVVEKGIAYWLVDHWKYVDFMREAKWKRLGKLQIKDGKYYITTKIKTRGQE
jgi:hypothetical protein